MARFKNQKYLVGAYLAVLVFLLLWVTVTPLMIQRDMSVTRRFIIEEGTLETGLIIILFGVSYLILKSFKRSLKAYEGIARRAGRDKSKLISRLEEAFHYIGTVNVEIQEIHSILCGVARYPQTKRELNRLIDHLAAKAMTVAGTPWIAVRMISRSSGRTIDEHTMQRRDRVVAPLTMGNKAILKGGHAEGLQTIATRQQNLDLLTVCILPKISTSKEQLLLITAIANQIEMLFMLYREGGLDQQSFNGFINKKMDH